VYKMRLAYAHFPINLTVVGKPGVEDQFVEIRNFLGERRLRRVAMPRSVLVKKSEGVKDEIALEGDSLEEVSGVSARVHESCLVKNKDIRKCVAAAGAHPPWPRLTSPSHPLLSADSWTAPTLLSAERRVRPSPSCKRCSRALSR
jgi:Ribosomal protein L6